jgi:putative hemolysin
MRSAIKYLVIAFFIFILIPSAFALLNPAKVYCEELGYEYLTVSDSEGSERGYCQLISSKVDAWDFLKGIEASDESYCSKEGYGIKTISDGEKCSSIFSLDCAVCLNNGKETEVTELMGLSFEEGTCGDNKCTLTESYLTCPKDCSSGIKDRYCDKVKDDLCDPDCSYEEDPDCKAPITEEGCIDNDDVCSCECVGKDNDCDNENISISCMGEAEQGEYDPVADNSQLLCVYDGICYESSS